MKDQNSYHIYLVCKDGFTRELLAETIYRLKNAEPYVRVQIHLHSFDQVGEKMQEIADQADMLLIHTYDMYNHFSSDHLNKLLDQDSPSEVFLIASYSQIQYTDEIARRIRSVGQKLDEDHVISSFNPDWKVMAKLRKGFQNKFTGNQCKSMSTV